jgi:Plasmid pRiA4b ORF-3-like protein
MPAAEEETNSRQNANRSEKMKKKDKKVYQFKITLQDMKPPIWRRIQVPESYTFWDMHVAIQDAMGWTDTHLHHFEIVNLLTGVKEEIGIPDEEGITDIEIHAGWKKNIADYFTNDNSKAHYVYDYGDNWEHAIKLEKILDPKEGVHYPMCIAGARACPPEDCGGVGGYEEFLEAIMDPNHEGYDEMLEWAGGDFDPDHFDPDDVVFDNPKKRLQYALFQ